MRFGAEGTSLEELILLRALGRDVGAFQREQRAGGVMMIPIPGAGLLERVDGIEAAQAVAGIEEIDITIRPNNRVVPLPEGNSYLGFIFARGDSPAIVEAALREAHAHLKFTIIPELPVMWISA